VKALNSLVQPRDNKTHTLLVCLFVSSGITLKTVPSDIMVAGFTGGTLRTFDLTGRPSSTFSNDESAERKRHAEGVCIKAFQKFGAAACQHSQPFVRTTPRRSFPQNL
jgi:hypothetical protein